MQREKAKRECSEHHVLGEKKNSLGSGVVRNLPAKRYMGEHNVLATLSCSTVHNDWLAESAAVDFKAYTWCCGLRL